MNAQSKRKWTHRGLVAAVAVVAAAMPLVAVGPAFADARSTVRGQADTGSGTVVQLGPVPIVQGGQVGPTSTRFTATVPVGLTGQVKARLVFDGAQLPPGGYTPQRMADRLNSDCAVNSGTYHECPWTSPFDGPDFGKLLVDLPTTEAASTITYNMKLSSLYDAFGGNQLLTGVIELTDADGNALATGAANFQYIPGVPDPQYRTALHAVDSAGVLWQYEGTGFGASPFKPRTRIGGGWNAYNAITSLNGTTADGDGDIVARDTSGVLWYYHGTRDPAAPFAPRARVGGGWNAYTALFGLGGASDDPAGKGDLLARDKAGVLWLYRARSGGGFQPRVKAGWGWNVYTAVTTFGAGVLAKDADGVLWSYTLNKNAPPATPLTTRTRVGGGWNTYTAVTGIRDATADGKPDLVARDKNGGLWLYTTSVNESKPDPSPGYVGGGWQIYHAIF